MKLSLTSIFTIAVFTLTSLLAEEKEWREMGFSGPAINFSIKISTSTLNQPKDTIGYVWDGKIKPVFLCVPVNHSLLSEFYSGACSIETYEYACKISSKEKSSKIKKEDALSPLFPEKIKQKKFMFSVSNNLKNMDETSFEGYVKEEEFKTLLTMIYNDVKMQTAKTRASLADSNITNFEALLYKKLKTFSEDK